MGCRGQEVGDGGNEWFPALFLTADSKVRFA